MVLLIFAANGEHLEDDTVFINFYGPDFDRLLLSLTISSRIEMNQALGHLCAHIG